MFNISTMAVIDGQKKYQTVPVRLTDNVMTACGVAKQVMGYVYEVPTEQIQIVGICPIGRV